MAWSARPKGRLTRWHLHGCKERSTKSAPLVGAMCAKSLYLVGKADVGRRHVSDRRHGGQSWTSSHRHHEETGEFRSIQVFDFVKHAPDHDTVLKRYETSLDAMAATRRPYTR